MASPDFDATWVPRIGEQGVGELRRFRRTMLILSGATPVLAVGAGLLFAVGGVGDLLGTVLVVVVAGCCVSFIRAEMRLAAALSAWFGVKIRGGQIPKMNPTRFDTWCDARGLHRPSGQGAGTQDAESSDMASRCS
jgi:hypothetical protein